MVTTVGRAMPGATKFAEVLPAIGARLAAPILRTTKELTKLFPARREETTSIRPLSVGLLLDRAALLPDSPGWRTPRHFHLLLGAAEVPAAPAIASMPSSANVDFASHCSGLGLQVENGRQKLPLPNKGLTRRLTSRSP